MHLAALQSDLEAVRALVEGGIDVNRDRTYKVSAARPRKASAVKGSAITYFALLLKAAIVIVHAAQAHAAFLVQGHSPMHIAAERGDVDIISLLLQSGAAPDRPAIVRHARACQKQQASFPNADAPLSLMLRLASSFL